MKVRESRLLCVHLVVEMISKICRTKFCVLTYGNRELSSNHHGFGGFDQSSTPNILAGAG
jgi:hypothetical protein